MGTPTGKVHIEIGTDKNVAYLFSCPGRHEEATGHPAAKGTGRNLDMLIEILRGQGLTYIPLRQDATVTNAWDKVEYEGLTNRSEADPEEVMASDRCGS